MIFRALIIWLCFSVSAAAQFAPSANDGSGAGSVSPDAAARLADILRDEEALNTLIAQLEAAATPDEAAAEPPAPQMSLARQIADVTRESAEGATAFVSSLIGTADDILTVFTGESQVNWGELRDAVISLALVMAVTITLFFVLRAVGMRIFRAMSSRATQDNWVLLALWLVGSSLIDAVIILLSWGGGYAFALATGAAGSMDFRQSLFLNAFLLIEMTKVVLRAILSPRFARLRFAPMQDETAAYWYFWSSRLVSLLGYGALLVVPVINATVSFAVGSSVMVLIALSVLLIAVLILLQNREPVAEALRARNKRDPDDAIGRVEAALAGLWHWLAIAYLVALFAIWTAHPGDALRFMLLATLNSVIAVVMGVAAMAIISRAIKGGLRVPEDLRKSLPLLEVRLNAFVPSILKVIRILIALAVLISVAQSWEVMDFLGWIGSEIGRDVTSRLASAVFVVLLAMGIWLAVSSFIEYRLNPAVGAVPTARERTLLALFRNAFTIALIVIGSMLTLAELGVNIAPLLAGAGVLGLAIGFGAQKLVQDIITGAFIQFENAMNEGDVVTVGGTSGVVEKLTIRSVGLRDLSGTYHLIPFSSVDMVSNFMKGFAFHVAEIGVAYREDISEVKSLMHKAYAELAEGELGVHILEPLDIQGVTSLGDSAVVVRGRIKTQPGMQWAVGRAYTEIVKRVLDDAGVEIPYPHMTLYMGQGKDGTAPPLPVQQVAETPKLSDDRAVADGGDDHSAPRAVARDDADKIARNQPGSDEAEQN